MTQHAQPNQVIESWIEKARKALLTTGQAGMSVTLLNLQDDFRQHLVEEAAHQHFRCAEKLKELFQKHPKVEIAASALPMQLNQHRVALAIGLTTIVGGLLALLAGWGNASLSWALLIILSPLFAYVMAAFILWELPAGFTRKLVVAGILFVTGSGAMAMATGWWRTWVGLRQNSSSFWSRIPLLGMLIAGLIALRIWARLGDRPFLGQQQHLEDALSRLGLVLERDQQIQAQALLLAIKPEDTSSDSLSDDALILLFDHFRKSSGHLRDVLEEIFTASKLDEPQTGQSNMVYSDRVRDMVDSGEVELIGHCPPGCQLRWVQLPVIHRPEPHQTRVLRVGRLEKAA